ncbi:FixH family protein [Indiicoccus explosivorum]|uniref:FixH family protein n=1 Tax=Indiicoccus explosivorum TaxID=1917864 RepID=UPI000B4414F5|nr:FixH family protein [Indiicoccus explosivorum]
MKKWMLASSVLFLLAGCGAEGSAESETEGTLQPVEVEILTAPTADPGDEVILSAEVLQGGEPVEEADEVLFEVWESGDRSNAVKLEGEHTAEGVYEAAHVFEEEGLYYLVAHTTANGLHTMPQMELTVGDPDPASIVPDESGPEDGMEHMEEGHDGHSE